jgi:hypothetical protein
MENGCCYFIVTVSQTAQVMGLAGMAALIILPKHKKEY